MTENKKEEALKRNKVNTTDFGQAVSTLWGSKITKTLVIGAVAFGILYLGKYLLNETAASIRAYKNLTSAIKE